jgi:hypothetical protein
LEDELQHFWKQLNEFKKSADALLASHEASKSRTITIEETYETLHKLSIKQDELIKQSLRCIENALYRAAHVLCWAALMDYVEEELGKDSFRTLNSVRPVWKVKSLEDLRDIGSDFQIIDALRDCGRCSKTEEKALKGLLNKRNECAHPTDYFPDLNQTLGYLSETLNRIATFQKRWT